MGEPACSNGQVVVMVRTRHRGWVRPLNAVESPSVRLVCFPFSGGSAGTYGPWSVGAPPDIQLMGVQYPGRADRMAEAPVGRVSDMGKHVAAELQQLDDVPTVLFGHSLGAIVAYETAMALRDNGSVPEYLLVSGSASPWEAGGGRTHLATDDELWSVICGLGGVDEDIADDPELRELMLPTLRADVTANERYRPRADAEPLPCPVRCYYNTGDPLVDAAELAAWGKTTSGQFSLEARPGGHFEILSDTSFVGDIVTALGTCTRNGAAT